MTSVEPSYGRGYLYSRWAILASTLFLVGTNAFVVAGVLPDIARDLGVSAAAVSYSITLYALVVAAAAPAISILVPSWSRTKLMFVGLAAISLGTVLAAAAPSLTVFIGGRLLAAFGGAALVPTATAAAASLAPAARRGQAIAVVGTGFTLSIAVGSPLGTAIAAATEWRVPLFGVAGLAVLVLPLLALLVRGVPTAPPITLSRRFAVLKDLRIFLPLIASILLVAGFNIVYIFIAPVTGFRGTPLAALLLIYGVLGIVGNTVSGPLTDRYGSRVIGTVFVALQAATLFTLAFLEGRFAPLAVVLAVAGLAAFGLAVPLQHRLVTVQAETAAVAISWYSTAMYLGIAAAPVLGAAAIHTGDTAVVPLIGTVVTVLALVAFQLGFARERSAARATAGSAPVVADRPQQS